MRTGRFIFALTIGAALAGCGGKPVESPQRPQRPEQPTPETPTPKTQDAPTKPPEKPPENPEPAPIPMAPPSRPPAVSSKTPPANLEAIKAAAANYLEKSPAGAWRVNEAAALELEKLDAAGRIGPALLSLFKDKSPAVRRGAVFYLLKSFDAADAAHVAAFSALLGDPEPTIRMFGLQAVRQMHAADQLAAFPQLITLLNPKTESNDEHRASVIRFFGGLNEQARSASNAVSESAAADPSVKVRKTALGALTAIGENTAILTANRRALADQDGSVRSLAVSQLQKLGAGAAPAAPELAATLADADLQTANMAGETLVLIGRPAIPEVVKQFAAKKAQARKLALACLGKMRGDAREALPQIRELLQDDDQEVRTIAAAVIKRLGGE